MAFIELSSLHWNLHTIFTSIIFLIYSCYGQSKNCVTNDACSCTFDDGSGVMDLSKLGLQGGKPLISDTPAKDGFVYSFNPCYPFNEGTCKKAAACQVDVGDNIYFDIGDQTNMTFSTKGKNVIGNYISSDGLSVSQVTYICDRTANQPKWIISGAGQGLPPNYLFSITSKEVCPKKGPHTGPTSIPSPTDGPSQPANKKGGLSTGWILVIIVLSVSLVYIVAGILINKLYRNGTGRELIPNVTFWSLLPGLIKDGCAFTCAKTCRRDAETYKAI